MPSKDLCKTVNTDMVSIFAKMIKKN